MAQAALVTDADLGEPWTPTQGVATWHDGVLKAKADRREQACTEMSTAIALYRAMEMTFWLPETEAALVQGVG